MTLVLNSVALYGTCPRFCRSLWHLSSILSFSMAQKSLLFQLHYKQKQRQSLIYQCLFKLSLFLSFSVTSIFAQKIQLGLSNHFLFRKNRVVLNSVVLYGTCPRFYRSLWLKKWSCPRFCRSLWHLSSILSLSVALFHI